MVVREVLSFEAVHESVVYKWEEIFLFLVTKGNLILCFSQGVNSIGGHESSRLVLRTCFRGDKTIYI